MSDKPSLTDTIDAEFDRYAKAVGYLLLEWNILHSDLEKIFDILLNAESQKISKAIWHSISNDKGQRKLISNLANCLFADPTDKEAQAVRSGIAWMLDKADRLSPIRDASAHSPVALLFGDTLEIVPNKMSGHPVSQHFKEDNLLEEINIYTKRIEALSLYARVMALHLRPPPGASPVPLAQKPEWPILPSQRKGASPSRVEREK